MGSNPTADKIKFHSENIVYETWKKCFSVARLAQLVERKALNLVVVGSSPTVGVLYFMFCWELHFQINFAIG